MANLDQLQPGPELDRMIAVEVMGYNSFDFNPSTNIAHVMEVLEKLAIMIFPNQDQGPDKMWVACKVGNHEPNYIDHGGHWIDGSIQYLSYGPNAR